MKVYCKGVNIQRPFPQFDQPLLKEFESFTDYSLRQIEVGYGFCAMWVEPDTVLTRGVRNYIFENMNVAGISVEKENVYIAHRNGCQTKLTFTANGYSMNPINGKPEENLPIDRRSGVDIKDGWRYGREHKVKVRNREVITSGRGSRGQLGHGDLEEVETEKAVEALQGISIEKVDAGYWHTVAISSQGDAYTWGCNQNGQLGIPEEHSVMAVPQALELDYNITNLACGGRHTVFLTDTNKLYGCGSNRHKQLKNVNDDNIFEPTLIHDFKDEIVLSLVCGPWNTLVCCEHKREHTVCS